MTGRIITIAQQKGGSGKTTVAANLAVDLARSGNRIAILDTDPQGSLGRWFMARIERDPPPEPEMAFRTASAWGARYEARQLARDNDFVIIDTPPKMGIDGRPAIEAADMVMIPVTPSPVDLWATEPTIETANGEDKPALLVLNRASSRTRLTGEMLDALKQLDCVCARTMIANRVIFAEAMRGGSSAVERKPGGPAAQEIAALTGEVLDLLKASG